MAMTAIILTGCVYTPNALRETIEAFSSLCEATFTTTEDESLLVELSCPSQQLADEFLNYALALSAQERLT
jgi:hypothetical protein